MLVASELARLAKDPSSENRRVLLRRVTDIFFAEDAERNLSEIALFEEVVTRLLADVDLSGRVEFAEQVADQDKAPHTIVMSLATSEIEVARPILTRSNVLKEPDLVHLASIGDDQALQAMSNRKALSELVTDVMVRRGSPLVSRALTANKGARFSKHGFAELVRRAEGDEIQQLRLVSRPDIPSEVVSNLVELLSQELKRGLVEKGVDLDQMQGATLGALRTGLEDVFARREYEMQENSTVIASVKSGKAKISAEIIRLAGADRAYDLATMMATLTRIEHATAIKALTGNNDEVLVVLFRLMGADSLAFEAVLRLRSKRQRKNHNTSEKLLRAYQEMDEATALRVMRFLMVRRQAQSHG